MDSNIWPGPVPSNYGKYFRQLLIGGVRSDVDGNGPRPRLLGDAPGGHSRTVKPGRGPWEYQA